MAVVCKESPKEYLQPFKDKLEEFFQKGRKLCQLHIHDTLRHPLFHNRSQRPTDPMRPGGPLAVPKIALVHLPMVLTYSM